MNMNVNLILIIMWLIAGISTIIKSLYDDYEVPLISFCLCWLVLIMQLIEEM